MPAARYALRRAESCRPHKDKIAERCLAKSSCVRQHGLKTGCKFAGRTGDDLSTSRGRGLLLQRFRKIIGALAQLIEQPRVLDGDDGLGSEVLNQLDLLVGEGTHLLAIDGDCTDQVVFLQHRDASARASAGKIGEFDDGLVALKIWFLGPDILDVRDLFGPGDMSQTAVRMRMKYLSPSAS